MRGWMGGGWVVVVGASLDASRIPRAGHPRSLRILGMHAGVCPASCVLSILYPVPHGGGVLHPASSPSCILSSTGGCPASCVPSRKTEDTRAASGRPPSSKITTNIKDIPRILHGYIASCILPIPYPIPRAERIQIASRIPRAGHGMFSVVFEEGGHPEETRDLLEHHGTRKHSSELVILRYSSGLVILRIHVTCSNTTESIKAGSALIF